MSLVILISGRGSNMQALLEAKLPVSAVISNRADAEGLRLAAARGVPTCVLEHRGFASREAFETALEHEIDRFAPRLIALTSFMRVLTPAFVGRYRERMLNIHPSLLPAFKGLDTHARALAAGVKLAGCTVHIVRPEVDSGPIIAQAAVPVLDTDTADSLGARVLAAEHLLYPHALSLFASGAISVSAERTILAQGAVNQANPLYWPPLS